MIYIENVFICLSAPLMIAIFCSRGKPRQLLIFLLSGMTACLLSSYISTFFAAAKGMDAILASLTLAPAVEEVMKLLPFLFYLMVFEPEAENISGCVLMVAVGFATFENVCYLLQNGTASILHLLIRGFGTGAMHVVCGTLVSGCMMVLWNQLWLRVAGAVGLLAVAMSYHGIYNILVSQDGLPMLIGCLLPIATTILGWLFGRKRVLFQHT